MADNVFYVLLVTWDKPDPHPSECWTFDTQAKAEAFLHDFGKDFLGGHLCDVNDMPPDHRLVAAFKEAGARVQLLECALGDDSYELVPFQREAVAA